MGEIHKEPFDQGVVDSVDRTDLKAGEMQTCTGGYYKRGDSRRLHQINGRSAFGDTGSGAKVKGLYLAGFDTADDLLLAYSGAIIYQATAGATGTFSSLVTGLSSSGTKLSGAHYNDRHYICNGYDTNRVIESDGTVYLMGMSAPVEQLGIAVANNSTGAVIRPAAIGGSFSNGANAVDGDFDTFAHVSRSSAGTSTGTFSGGAWTGAAASRTLVIKWSLSGETLYEPDQYHSGALDDSGGRPDIRLTARVLIELSTDSGVTFATEVLNQTTSQNINTTTTQYPVAADPDLVQVKVSLVMVSGTGVCSLRIYDCRLQTGSTSTAFSTDAGFYYSFSEYDQTRGHESPLGPISSKQEWTTKNEVTLTLPSSTQNTRTTHWFIYRTADGGSAPHQLGRIGIIASAQTTFIDDFQEFGQTDQPRIVSPFLTLELADSDNPLRFPRDVAPPAFRRIRAFKSFLVGLRQDNLRALHYCVPGFPESWPDIYFIDSFPMEEHDELVDVLELGDNLLIAATGVMMRTDDLPRIVSGQFDAAQIHKIQGAPGLVSEYGLTGLSIGGEPYAAWISPYGIYITDGATHDCISDEISGFWQTVLNYDKSSWVLHWDKWRQCLVFAYSATSGGVNNRYRLLHMAPEHRKANGAPRITGPHYGNLNHIVSGQVSSAHRVYSAHTSDGKVYLEDNASVGTDASNAYDSSGTVPMIWKTRRLKDDAVELAALKAWLRHSDFGSAHNISTHNCSVAWTTGRDSSDIEQTRTQNIDLNGQKETLFDVARGGEWHEVQFTYTGSGLGAIQDLKTEFRPLGGTGKVSIS